MRVLPFWGITAPRFPFEKSYSAFILSSLLSRRTTRRDESVLFIPLRPYDHQQFASASQPDRYETSLSLGIRVGDGNGQGIFKNAFSVGERDFVLSQILRCLEWIVLKTHRGRVYILYV